MDERTLYQLIDCAIRGFEAAIRSGMCDGFDSQAEQPTLRDRFAMAALQGMLAYSHADPKTGNWQENADAQTVASNAYVFADAMMAERAHAGDGPSAAVPPAPASPWRLAEPEHCDSCHDKGELYPPGGPPRVRCVACVDCIRGRPCEGCPELLGEGPIYQRREDDTFWCASCAAKNPEANA